MGRILSLLCFLALASLSGHTRAGDWTACVGLSDGSYPCSYPTIDLKTKVEAEKFVRDNYPRSHILTVRTASPISANRVTYRMEGPQLTLSVTPWLYGDNRTPSQAQQTYPSSYPDASIAPAIARLEAWATANLPSCSTVGVEEVGEWQEAGGPLIEDGVLEGVGSKGAQREIAQVTFFSWLLDANNNCTVRHLGQAAGIYRARVVYCDDPDYHHAGNVCYPSTAAQVTGPLEDCSAPTCRELAGNPINLLNGEKFYSSVDGEWDGIQLSRHYQSYSRDLNDQIAVNWVHSFSSQVIGGNYAYMDANGKLCRLAAQGSTYICTRDESIVAIRNSDLTYQVQFGSHYREHFDSAGLLKRREYPSGSAVDVERNATGKVTALVSHTGRRVVFNYNENLVSSIDIAGTQVSYQYDGQHRLVGATYADGSTRGYLYEHIDYPELLTSVKDELENTLSSYNYDSYGRATSSQSGGQSVSVAYDTTAQSTTVTDGLGHALTYAYQGGSPASRFITSSTSNIPGHASENWTWNLGGVLAKYTTAGLERSYTRSSARRLLDKEIIRLNGVANRTIDNTWDASLPLLKSRTTKNSAGVLLQKLERTYNSRGQVLSESVIDSATNTTRTTTFTYCETPDLALGLCPVIGLRTGINGPRTDVQDVVSYSYYAADHPSCVLLQGTCPFRKGDLRRVTNALGHFIEAVRYDNAGNLVSSKDWNGVATDLELQERGWPIARKVRGGNDNIEFDDSISRLDYWANGLVRETVQPDGSLNAYAYDDKQRWTDLLDGNGNRIRYTLDAAGNRIAEDTEDSLGNLARRVSRSFNQLGQIQELSDAYGHSTEFSFDTRGNIDTQNDARNVVTDFEHDPLSRLTRTLQDAGGAGSQSRYEYDSLDNLTKMVDPKGLSTTFTYNGLRELKQLLSPDTGLTSFTYDSGGNRKSRTDSRGRTVTYNYDALNRIISISYAAASLDTAYVYDVTQSVCLAEEAFSIGRLTKLTDASGDTQYCYDRFGNVVRKMQTTNDVALTVRYAYTLAGQLSSVTYPDGAIASYARDAQGRTTLVNVQRAGAATEVLLNQASYHPFGPVAGWTYGNGRQLLRPLNQNYQPTAIQDTASGGLSVGFQYDPVGNLTQLTPAAGTTPLVRFDYDALRRLTAFKDGPTDVAIESYTYDATGNRQSFTNAAGTQAYSYPTTSHRLNQVGAIARGYDNAGNTTTIGGMAKEFVYDDTGRMSQVLQNAMVQRNYAYNGKGEQVRKYVGTANTYTLYDEAGHWLGDYDSSGTALQQAIWLDDLPVGLIANGNQLHYVEPDHLGTPRVVIEVARNVPVWTWDLKSEAFGNNVPNQDPDGDATPLVLDMRFPGQRFDNETGLNQNYFRDYDPAVGRYVQSDPTGLRGGLSTYSYTASNPLVSTDVFGLVSWKGHEVGFGAYYGVGVQGSVYQMKSECACNRKVTALVLAGAAGFGASASFASGLARVLVQPLLDAPWSLFPQEVEFYDYLDCPDPSVFNGLYDDGSIQLGPWQVGGSSFSRAFSQSSLFEMSGEFGLGFNISLGAAGVISQKTEDCCSK